MAYSSIPYASSVPLTQFRSVRPGPEALIQDNVARQIPDLFCLSTHSWAGTSVPIGAGVPDLVVVTYNPQVFALANIELSDTQILAYLRAVGKCRLETIAEKFKTSPEKIGHRLDCLIETAVVKVSCETFSLSPSWKDILPEIVTIEVKVSDWRRALRQAARNRIFAHLSFIALPEKIAQRVYTDELFQQNGIGLISVSESGSAAIIKRAQRANPVVWTYYYKLASFLAKSRQE